MGKRSKTIIDSFSAAFKRLLKAIETHGHPDLADKTHTHPDLASKEDLNDVIEHYIPGSKRQCVRMGSVVGAASNADFLDADLTVRPDPAQSPQTTNYVYLIHFNENDWINKSYWLNYGSLNDRPYDMLTNMGFNTKTKNVLSSGGVYLGDGVTQTKRVYIGSEGSNITFKRWNRIPYPKDYWSESFVVNFPISTSNFSEEKKIFRHINDTGGDNSISISNNNGLQICCSAGGGALYVRLHNASGTPRLYVSKGDIINAMGGTNGVGGTAPNGLRSGVNIPIELYYNDGKYSLWINGNSVILRSTNTNNHDNRTAAVSTLNSGVEEYTFGNIALTGTVKWGAMRMFGGSAGGGFIGHIDEYAYKEFTDSSYDPSAQTIAESPPKENNPGTLTSYIGTSTTVDIMVSDAYPVVGSASNKLNEYTAFINNKYSYTDLPLNNRVYFYLDIIKNNNGRIVTPRYTLTPPTFGRSFDNTRFACLFKGPNDYYGRNWVVGDPDKIFHGTIGDDEYVFFDYFQFNGTTNGDKTFVRSDINKLPNRWTIRVAYTRGTPSTRGSILHTIDVDGAIITDSGINIWIDPDTGKINIKLNDNSTIIFDAGAGESGANAFVTSGSSSGDSIMFELFYTGFKYGLRIGKLHDDVETWYSGWPTILGRNDIYWFTYTTPITISTANALSICSAYDGDNGFYPILGAKYLGFSMVPYVYAFHDGYLNRPDWTPGIDALPEIQNMNKVDPDILYFDKEYMEHNYIVSEDDPEIIGVLNFKTDPKRSLVFIGRADLDQGGVTEVITYNLNGHYDSGWFSVMVPVSGSNDYTLRHSIGDNELDVTILGTDDADGTNVKILNDAKLTIVDVTSTQLTLRVSTGAVVPVFVKISALRNW